MHTLLQDIRYGLRMMRRSPGFTVVAVLTLALGIGANTAIFGVIDALMVQNLPAARPEQLVQLRRMDTTGATSDAFSDAEYRALQGIDGLSLAAFTGAGVRSLEINGEVQPQPVGELYLVDGGFFPLLDITPVAGRLLTSVDDEQAAPVAVISEDLADRSLGSAQAAIGKAMTLNGASLTIVGVTPRRYRGLRFPGSFGIAVPIRLSAQLQVRMRPGNGLPVTVIGRLNGVGLSSAQAAADAAFQSFAGQSATQQERVVLTDIRRGIPSPKFDPRAQYGGTLFALMGGVAVLLLIACVNVGNLLLARGAARTHELAVCLSLGASHGRIVRQLFVESILLALCGGALGLLLALWGTDVLASRLPANLRMLEQFVSVRPNPAVLAFTLIVASVCAVLFGVLPAFHATRVDPIAGLRENVNRAGQRAGRLDRGMVAAQMALALLLVTSAGLLVKTLGHLHRGADGFEPERLLAADVEVRDTPYQQTGMRPLYGEMLRRLRQLPGVTAAGAATRFPLVFGAGPGEEIEAPGYQPSTSEDMSVDFVTATPGYLAAAGIALMAGRDFGPEDGATAPHVAIISEEIAKRYFGGRDPIGETIRRADGETLHIIGVAADARYYDLRAPALRTVYTPFEQSRDWGFLVFAVRTTTDPGVLTSAARGALHAAAPGITVRWVQTMERVVDNHLARERTLAWLASLFGAIALTLAAIGLYGVMAYQVAARTFEIGVRMALGADRERVVRMVMRQSLRVVTAGAAVGVPLSLGAGRALAAQLYGVAPSDPATILLAVLVLFGIGVLASFMPARRAARVDPMTALRCE
jgi:putative ABC transport system permease protein